MNCAIVNDHLVLTCDTVPGVGTGLHWVIQLDGQLSAVSEPFSSYHPPSLDAITLRTDAGAFSTLGGEEVEFAGANFGPTGTEVNVFYGISTLPAVRAYASIDSLKSAIIESGSYYYEARNCDMTDHPTVRCNSAPGAGPSGEAGHTWWAEVASQFLDTSNSATEIYLRRLQASKALERTMRTLTVVKYYTPPGKKLWPNVDQDPRIFDSCVLRT